MTVASNNYLPLLFAGDGHTVVFAFTWEILSDGDLVVMLYSPGSLVTLVEGVDYTLNAQSINTPSGGSITAAVAPAVGMTLILSRAVPNNQQLSLGNAGSFYPQDLEKEFDRIILLTQQLQYLIAACVQLPANILPANFNPQLPINLVGASNMILSINAAGNAWTLVPFTPPGLTMRTIIVGVNYVVPIDIDLVVCNPQGGGMTVTLPNAALSKGRLVRMALNGGAGLVNVQTAGGLISGNAVDTFNGAWDTRSYISDGQNWYSFFS